MESNENKAEKPETPGGSSGSRCELSALLIKADGTKKDYGVVSTKMVTTVGVKWVVDLMAGNHSEQLKYHGSGTGVTAEAVGDTALVSEIAIARGVGTRAAATANPNATYTSVGLQTYTGGATVAEHGIFSNAAGATLFDRSLLSPTIAVNNGDSIQWTYVWTLNAGG